MTPLTALAVRAVRLAAVTLLSYAVLRVGASLLAAIAKRVLGLLVVGVIGGLVLFKLGLSAFQ